MSNNEKLKITNEWDKVFPLSDKVNHKKVTFKNHFGITLVADMYEPKEYKGKLSAIAVAGPYGAVKEQSSGLYAQEMADRGFITTVFGILSSQELLTVFNIHNLSIIKLHKIFHLLQQ